MITCVLSFSRAPSLAAVLIFLALTGPVSAQQSRPAGAPTLESFRAQYDIMMANFERIYAATSDTAGQERARQGRDAMQALTHDQLAQLYAQTRIPDLSVAVTASGYVASRVESSGAAAPQSLPFPAAPDLISECSGLPIDSASRFALLILKEVASGILAAATFVCTQDILGENGSLACVPLAIASDIANGVFDSAQYCAGEFTANQVDGNYNRLGHIHDDLSAGITTIVNNSNANTTSIINNANANKDTLVGEIRALGCEIVRLLNTPEGLRASSILACSAQPGFPYSWNRR